jgi:hypothetical protein
MGVWFVFGRAEKDLLVNKVEEKDLFSKEVLAKGVYAAVSAKQHGFESFLAPLIAEACLTGTRSQEATAVHSVLRFAK